MRPRTTLLMVAGIATVAAVVGFADPIDKVINSRGSLYLNIDSDNNSGNEILTIATDTIDSIGGMPLVTVLENGFVGLGTTDPTNPVHIYHPTTNGVLTLESGDADVQLNFVQAGSSGSRIKVSAGGMSFGTNDQLWMTIDENGRVGIGENNPGAALEVVGDVTIRGGSADEILIGGDETGVPDLHFRNFATTRDWVLRHDEEFFHFQKETAAGTEVMTLRSDGRVGIGTTNPTQRLEVAGGDITVSGGVISLWEGNTAVMLHKDDDNAFLSNKANFLGNGADSGGELVLNGSAGVRLRYGDEASSGTDGLVLSPDGNVSVQVLEITGGADLSERFDVAAGSATPKPGMVVCIDPEKDGELIVSGTPYDRTVAGVISGAGGVKPGLLMGQSDTDADGSFPVAVAGRVYVWCDGSTGAIRRGDLLTTSGVPGHAMKVTDYTKAQGAILGKAMSPLDDGRGLVLVLVSLQ